MFRKVIPKFSQVAINAQRAPKTNFSLQYFSTSPEEFIPQPPTQVTKELVQGIHNTTKFFVENGLTKQKLDDIAKAAGDEKTLTTRWQKMMEAYLGTQVHVLAALGYQGSEQGLRKFYIIIYLQSTNVQLLTFNGVETYNQQLAVYMHNADPSTQEEMRVSSRDLWRTVLSTAFNVSLDDISNAEMDLVKARETMHKLSQKMQSPQVLESIAEKCGKIPSTGNAGMDMAMKHQVVQEALVHDVYLGGNPSLVEECGFGTGEKAYVFMQCVMAQHQTDPLVAQYVGTGMMRVLQSAGIDLSQLEAAANDMRNA